MFLPWRPSFFPGLAVSILERSRLFGCGSKLTRRGYAGFGPCFLPLTRATHFGTGFLSHDHLKQVLVNVNLQQSDRMIRLGFLEAFNRWVCRF